jgi:hypothetical protein
MSEQGYFKSLDGVEWWATLARGAIGFRYGPYTGEEVGRIMEQCVNEGIPLIVSATCGREFDWDVAREFARGNPADWQAMDSAPKDGTDFIAEVAGVECRVVWWKSWEWWREAGPNGSVGRPVQPTRWRTLTDAERGEEVHHPDGCTCVDCVGF